MLVDLGQLGKILNLYLTWHLLVLCSLSYLFSLTKQSTWIFFLFLFVLSFLSLFCFLFELVHFHSPAFLCGFQSNLKGKIKFKPELKRIIHTATHSSLLVYVMTMFYSRGLCHSRAVHLWQLFPGMRVGLGMHGLKLFRKNGHTSRVILGCCMHVLI